MQRRSRAFSLVELLVVLFVVVLMTSLASLSLSPGAGDRVAERAARDIMGVAAYALDEAQFTGRDHGLRLVQDAGAGTWRTQWLERWPEGWRRPESARDVWRAQELGQRVVPELSLEDRPVALQGDGRALMDAAPPVVFYASGETVPGALVLRDADGGAVLWRLRWDLLGRFTLENARGDVDGS